MVRRRTSKRTASKKKSSRKRKGGKSSLKERFLTTAIWGLSLVNIILIFSLVSNFVGSPDDSGLSAIPVPEPTQPDVEERITVQVLNACGVTGLAREVTEFLRDNNFDVVDFGNYTDGIKLERTLIFDRTSMSSKNALKVARALDVSKSQVVPQLEDSQQLMVTVLVGKDYQKLTVFANK